LGAMVTLGGAFGMTRVWYDSMSSFRSCFFRLDDQTASEQTRTFPHGSPQIALIGAAWRRWHQKYQPHQPLSLWGQYRNAPPCRWWRSAGAACDGKVNVGAAATVRRTTAKPRRRGGAQFIFTSCTAAAWVSDQSIEYFHGFQQTSQKCRPTTLKLN
jgi:hypothetical protein